jgi:hypothetical protein
MLLHGGGLYHGTEKEGIAVGFGCCSWPDNSSYIGEWQDSLPHGFGCFQFSSGEGFDGEWTNGIRKGLGMWRGADGSQYQGEFSQSTFHGSGFMRNGDTGHIYHGIFESGSRAGIGIVLWEDGSVYVGGFVNDLRHGSALEILAEGQTRVATDAIYEHDRLCYRQPRWVGRGNTIRTVVGGAAPSRVVGGMHVAFESVPRQRSRPFRLQLDDGAAYVGQTRDQQLDGRGRVVYGPNDAEGRTEYDGGFQRGRQHGIGVMRWRDGAVYAGTWDAGARAGFGIHAFPPPQLAPDTAPADAAPTARPDRARAFLGQTAARYAGGLLAGRFHGFGVLSSADGAQLCAAFAEGEPAGPCVVIAPDGRREIFADPAGESGGCERAAAGEEPATRRAETVERLARRAQAAARAVAGMADGGPAATAAAWAELTALPWATERPREA